ncbi:hypothetical protein TWF281_001362 [Arthrobotrys megalospora]
MTTSSPLPDSSGSSSTDDEALESDAESALTNLPQEILLHIAKQLPTVLDVFVLRQACRSLYNRLGPSSGTLYYHFLNNCNGPHRRRFLHYQKNQDYFTFTKDILSGKIDGCGICLREVKAHTAVDAYKGGIFYKRVCKSCGRANFKGIHYPQILQFYNLILGK